MPHKPRKQPGENQTANAGRRFSRRRVWLFRVIAILGGPVLFLGLLELGLRAVGYGYNPRVAVPCEIEGKPCLGENAKFGWRFFPPTLAREFEPFIFPARKGADTCRIFVLGASAAQGAPNNAFRFGRLLEVMLCDRFPGLRFEVVTAAMAAINSHVVLEIAKDCARYEPDLFVVYLGNNEVVGPYGPGTVLTPALSNLHLIRLGIAVRATKLGQLVSNIGGIRGLGKDKLLSWRGMQMFLGEQVRADDPRLKTTYSHFQQNLEDICQAAASGGAQTVLCTVATNLRDCPPFASLHRPGLPAQQLTAWDTAYKEGTIAEMQGRHAEAIASYRKAAEIDGSYAELQFRLGGCYEVSGDDLKARDSFVQARDLDTLRFRADTRIDEVIRTVADHRRSQGVWLADVARAADANSPHALAGEELFYEHVHLTFRGAYVVARTVLEQIEPRVVERFREKAQLRGEAPTCDQCAERLGYNEWSRAETLDMVLRGFLAKPPFTNQLGHKEQMEQLNARLQEWQTALTPETLEKIGERYRAEIAKAPTDWRLRWDYGQMLAEDLKQYDAALEQYRIVQGLLPHCYLPHDSLASVLRARGDLAGAIAEYEKLLAIKPTSGSSYYHLGWCHNKQGRADLAEGFFRKAIRCEPDYVLAYLDLAELLFKSNRLLEAEQVCRDGLTFAPNHAMLHGNLGILLVKTGRREEGTAEIRRALELDPTSPKIRRLAETLLGPAAIR
ncbi:MAG: tetratricopeptide repeat protein [Phycisphaerae bacterium]|nr:tetratricopeptide repeat protein [Phycisphaerae bacterium]